MRPKQTEHGLWYCEYTLDKYEGDIAPFAERGAEHEFFRGRRPYEKIRGEKNVLANLGIDVILQLLTGAASPTPFNAANCFLGVGDSSTAAVNSQTDLQASSNKLRKAMDSTFPSEATQTATFKSTFASADANFAWAEWALFNAAAAATMLNRKVAALGTKASGTSWALTVTVSLA